MKLTHALMFATAVLATAPACADEFGTAKEAEAMVQKAIKHVAAVGRDKALGDFSEKKAEWVDRDLYLVVLGPTGLILAHGTNPKLVGKDFMTVADVEGKLFTKEMVEQTKAKGKAWIDYKFTDSVTKKVLPKSSYCEKSGDMAVCVGIYKR